jgi:5-methylcytosine-specific restriction protein A
MRRTYVACAERGCPELTRDPTGRCASHKPTPWVTSTRRERMGGKSGSAQQKVARAIIRRDLGRCHVCGQPGADQVDHVVPLSQGGADEPSNLAAIHRVPCHALKTGHEAARARRLRA